MSERLAEKLGGARPVPPLRQEAFELDETVLWRRIDSPSVGLLQDYHTDLAYVTAVDPDLLRYLLPYSMEIWQEAMWGDLRARECAGELHVALSRHPHLVGEVLGPDAEEAVLEAATTTLLSYVTRRATLWAPTLDWVPFWAGLSCGLPQLAARGWRSLVAAANPGCASAIVCYVVRVAYPALKSPLFPEEYGGPEPWGRLEYITSGSMWTAEAVQDLRTELDSEVVRGVLNASCGQFEGESRELCEMLADDYERVAAGFSSRLEEVARNLRNPDPPRYWSDAFTQ